MTRVLGSRFPIFLILKNSFMDGLRNIARMSGEKKDMTNGGREGNIDFSWSGRFFAP